MVWPELLLGAVLATLSLAPSLEGGQCQSGSIVWGECTTGKIGGDGQSVDLIAEEEREGSGGGNGGGDGAGGTSDHGSPWTDWRSVDADTDLRDNPACEAAATDDGVLQCSAPWSTVPEDGDDEETPPVTLSDIASFRPTAGTQAMQPHGWTIPGLHTNFYATTSRHVVNGTLLGRPASVRFTPVAFHWDYGDGTAATLPTRGATWDALGVDEFDPTPTSHVYEHEGQYLITLTISFAPEYRYAGSSWTPIAGTIPLRANDLRITVDGAKTVLVDQDCLANPAGPGC